MKKLNYKTLEEIKYDGFILKEGKEKILQFGTGNFLRAFTDYFVDVMNEKAGFNAKVVIVQPHSKNINNDFLEQEGLFTLLVRGNDNGKKINEKRIISSIKRVVNPQNDFSEYLSLAKNPDLRFIVSNTTEAGIVFDDKCKFDDKPADSFPGKLCQLLYERYKLGLNGFIILSCELIAHNGKELKKCVISYANLWKLGDDFIKWLDTENVFSDTLVDRIVTGSPKDEAEKLYQEFGYEDHLIDIAEAFSSWVIEADQSLYKELPIKESGLDKNILIVDNHVPYKERKVRILNGAHTSIVLGSYLAGFNIVRDLMNDNVVLPYMNKVLYDEVIPTLDLPKDELESFAKSVTDRFNNPYIDHELLSISLNSTSKWKARVMPSLLEYVKRFNKLPEAICMSFAFYIKFYHNANAKGDNCLKGIREKDTYNVKDDKFILDFYYEHKDDSNEVLVKYILDNEKMFGEDLKNLAGFYDEVLKDLNLIDKVGCYAAMRSCL